MKRVIVIFIYAVLTVDGLAQELSLSLDDCRQMALRNDVRVRNAGLDVLSARLLKQEVFTEYFPKVSISSYGFLALDPLLEIGVNDILGEGDVAVRIQSVVDYLGSEYGLPVRFSTLKSGFAASVTAVQPLYAGGRIVAANRLASLGTEASVIQDGMTRREVIESVDKDYWNLVSLEEKMETLETSELFLDNMYKDVATFVEAGLALDTDLMELELKRNELKRLRLSLMGGIRMAKMKFFDAIGQKYRLVKNRTDTQDPYIDDIVLSEELMVLKKPEYFYIPEEDVVAQLPETKLLDIASEEKVLEKRLTLGEVLPQIGVGAAYGYSQAINDRFNGIVFAMLKIPVSDWGKTSRRLKRLDYEIQKTYSDNEHLRDMLTLQVRSLWLDLNVAWENVSLAREAVELAQKKSDRMLDQYGSGLVTLSDVLESRALLRSAIDADTDARTAYATVLMAYLSRMP